NTGAVDNMGRDLAAIVFGEPYELPKERVEISMNPENFQDFAGKYQLAANFILTFTRDGDRLMTQATGQPQAQVFPESESKFFLKVVDAQITFVRDDTGRVSELILHQGGRDQHAKRIE